MVTTRLERFKIQEKEIGCESVDWIHLAQHRMHFTKSGQFVNQLSHINYSRRTLLRGYSYILYLVYLTTLFQ
jgi:hypothetical protein